MNIKDLRPGMTGIDVVFIVLEAEEKQPNKPKHHIHDFKVADKTASINATIWGEAGGLLNAGDIVRLTNSYTTLWNGCLRLCNNKYGEVQKIDEFCMLFSEEIDMSDPEQYYKLITGAAESSNSATYKRKSIPTPLSLSGKNNESSQSFEMQVIAGSSNNAAGKMEGIPMLSKTADDAGEPEPSTSTKEAKSQD